MEGSKPGPASLSKRQFAFEVLVNWLLPYLVYEAARRNWRLDDTKALICATVVPGVVVIVELVRKRKFDVIATTTLFTLVVSILVAVATEDARLLQLRESYLSALIGCLMIGSYIVRRPALCWITPALMPKDRREHLKHPRVQKLLGHLTLIWGIVSTLELVLKWWMIQRMSIAAVLAWGPVAFGLLTIIGMAVSAILFVKVKESAKTL